MADHVWPIAYLSSFIGVPGAWEIINPLAGGTPVTGVGTGGSVWASASGFTLTVHGVNAGDIYYAASNGLEVYSGNPIWQDVPLTPPRTGRTYNFKVQPYLLRHGDPVVGVEWTVAGPYGTEIANPVFGPVAGTGFTFSRAFRPGWYAIKPTLITANGYRGDGSDRGAFYYSLFVPCDFFAVVIDYTPDPSDDSGLTLQFDASGSQIVDWETRVPLGIPITGYQWTFYDTHGAVIGTSSLVNPTFRFPGYGTVSASLVLIDDSGLPGGIHCTGGGTVSPVLEDKGGKKAALAFDPHSGTHHHFYIKDGRARVTRGHDEAGWAMDGTNDFAVGGTGGGGSDVVTITRFKTGGLFGCVYGTRSAVFVALSKNEGETWSAPMTITAGQLIDTHFDEHGGMLYTLFKDADSGAPFMATQHLEHDDTLSAPQITAAANLPSNLKGAALTGTGGLLILTVQNGDNIDRYTANNNDGSVWS